MKYQEKQNWKRKAAGILALLIALAMVAGLVTPFIVYGAQVTTAVMPSMPSGTAAAETPSLPAAREKEFGQDWFTLDAEVGFDGEYIVGKSAPLRGVITNHGAAFRGELQAKVYTYEETGSEGTAAEYAVYYQELELLEGASQKIEMEINMGTIRRFLQVTLVDEKGNTVFLQNISLRAKAPNALATAVLSERPQDMQVLAGMKPPEADRTEADAFYRTYFFDAETFPATRTLMENFRIVVADGIDFAALSPEQRDALCGWAADGGMLVIGTGETGGRTLAGLGLTENISVSGTAAGSIEGTPATLAVLEGEGLEPLRQENGAVLAYEKKAGAGRILLPTFSLSNAPMAARAETPEILWEICRMADSGYLALTDETDDGYYYYRSSDKFPPMGEGMVRLLLGLLAAYVVIVGPVLYLVLKKLDKREKGWIAVPVLAVVFMAGVLAISKASPYGRGMVRLVSEVELAEGMDTAVAQTELYLKCADRGSVTYRNEEKLPLFPRKERYYYYNMPHGETSCGYKMLSGDRTEITFFDKQSWSTSRLTAETMVQTGGAMENTLRMENGRLKGAITNGTNTGFVDSILSVNGIWLRIGPMQAGETLEIDEQATLDGTDTYSMFSALFYNNYGYNNTGKHLSDMVRSGEISRDEAFRLRCEEQMMENILYNEYDASGMESGEMRMEFYGFSEASALEDLGTLNGREPFVSALTMYHQTFATALAKIASFDIPFAIRAKAVETEQQYEWNSRLWGNGYFYLYDKGEVVFVYGVAENIDLALIQFAEITDRNMLARDPEIYNASTGEWEPLRWTEYTSPQDYISAEREVRVRMEISQEHYEVEVPGMRVKGSGLLAGN